MIPAADEHVSPDSVIISSQLRFRPARRSSWPQEQAALARLADALPQGPAGVLKQLARLGIQLCQADTAGVSVLERNRSGAFIFRWQALAGQLERFEGGETPREWSPCGSCLDAGKAMLYSFPARYFTYFNDVDPPIVEGLVIPMYADGSAVGTIWIVSHHMDRRFDAEDVRIMTSLGRFAATVLQPTTMNSLMEQSNESTGQTKLALQAHGGTNDRRSVWNDYIRRIAHNDHSALASLFHETSPFLFHAALRILGFRSDAEEIVSDAFVRIWKSAYTYNEADGTPLGWMLIIVRNLAFDRLRARSAVSASTGALAIECSQAENPEAAAFSHETTIRLQQCVKALPPQQRKVIELAYFSELSHTEIAHLLREPLGTIKTRIRLALIRLRLLLATDA